MPGPLSLTVTVPEDEVTMIRPPRGVNLTAFVSRFEMARTRRSRRPSTNEGSTSESMVMSLMRA